MTLVEVQLAQIVTQFHHFVGLHEGRQARGTLVLYQTFNLAAVGGEQRYHGTSVAYRYLGVRRGPPFTFGTRKSAAYLSVYLGGLAGFGAPNLCKGGGCVVVELPMVVDEFAKQRVYHVEL